MILSLVTLWVRPGKQHVVLCCFWSCSAVVCCYLNNTLLLRVKSIWRRHTEIKTPLHPRQFEYTDFSNHGYLDVFEKFTHLGCVTKWVLLGSDGHETNFTKRAWCDTTKSTVSRINILGTQEALLEKVTLLSVYRAFHRLSSKRLRNIFSKCRLRNRKLFLFS